MCFLLPSPCSYGNSQAPYGIVACETVLFVFCNGVLVLDSLHCSCTFGVSLYFSCTLTDNSELVSHYLSDSGHGRVSFASTVRDNMSFDRRMMTSLLVAVQLSKEHWPLHLKRSHQGA